MRYVPLVTLRIRHPYYGDGRCPDFEVRLSASGRRVVERHRLIARPTADGLTLIAAVDGEGAPPVELADDTAIGLELALRNPDFARFTDLGAFAGNAAPRLVNADAPAGGELTLREREAFGSEALRVQDGGGEQRFALAGEPRPGVELDAFVVEGEGASVVAYAAATRTLSLDCAGAQAGALVRLRYPTTPALPRGVFAEVELRGGGATWLAAAPAEYTITFTPRRARWIYYVVTDVEDGDFAIVDTASEAALLFSAANRRDLGAEPDAGDPQAQALEERYPSARRLRFTSDAAVACSDQPRRGLELRLDGERLPFALPNPPLRNFTARDVVVDETPQRQESLFRVVKHLTTSLHPNG
ncbi:MAG: hypothetical protein R3A79_13625 [Nannocystaceae bacterium]